jgi:myo-inositol-1(or 4)-monophosphatase
MEFLQAALEANIEIFNMLRTKSRDALKEKKSRGYGGDVSIAADLAAEKVFIKRFKNFGSIYSEEAGLVGRRGGDMIILDPLDGSDNFLSDIPCYGTSAALRQGNTITHAAVANLCEGTLYLKSPDTFERVSLIDMSRTPIIKNPFSSVGIYERSYANRNLHRFVREEGLKYRSLGALAISLALAHEVDFVLFQGLIREFDIAAGWYMCEDLWRYKSDNALLVSKDKEIFDKISHFMKEQSADGIFESF